LGPDPVVVFFVDPDETFHFYSGQDPAVWFNSYGNRIMVIFFVQGTPLTRLCITTYTVGPNDAYPYTTAYPTLLYIFFADNNFNAFRVQATTADGRLRFKRYCDRYPPV
jgi:hypothetical protein